MTDRIIKFKRITDGTRAICHCPRFMGDIFPGPVVCKGAHAAEYIATYQGDRRGVCESQREYYETLGARMGIEVELVA